MPAQLSRHNPRAHKNTFGHVLILAGSRRMLGAAALTGLAAMRSGAGLATLGIPSSLNTAAQKKISNTLMTWPLPETSRQSLSLSAWPLILKKAEKFDAVAVGPGLSDDPRTQQLVRKIVTHISLPMVIDADGLNALAGHLECLKQGKGIKVLTPHPGEMERLAGIGKRKISDGRAMAAKSFARRYGCVLLLKGHKTVVASPQGKIYTNRTGNEGMATAGSGDVLTGMIAAFLGQGMGAFEAACFAAHLHGKAGNLAARHQTKTAMIASDIIDFIPAAFKSTIR
ncbi:MAG: NAD(P)H-hydrate dehydratase [Candidatus Omnitrophota bacterium]|nr:NAD(P)H-hydrate dehydratase [Candidatus Omnitrophota bacterium]